MACFRIICIRFGVRTDFDYLESLRYGSFRLQLWTADFID